MVLEEILMAHPRKRVLVFTDNNEAVYEISRRFLVPAITHLTPTKERGSLLAVFNQGEYLVLVTSMVLIEGVNIPEASVAVVLAGSTTIREHVQRLGRILRPRQGKEACSTEWSHATRWRTRSAGGGATPPTPRPPPMLCSQLLLNRRRGPYVEPCYLDPGAPRYLDLAAGLIERFTQHDSQPRRLLRQGLVKLLFDERCQFCIDVPLRPEELRHQVLPLNREQHPLVSEPNLIYPVTRQHVLDQVALHHGLLAQTLDLALYADLPEHHLLERFTAPEPQALL